jgi:general secretion pathway protein J
MPRQRGFTLLELLVAVAVFAVMGVMAYGGLQAVINQQEIARENAQRLREIQFAVRRIALDLHQAQPRPVRDELGDGYRGAVLADERNIFDIELTRGGWSNPLAQPRAAIQRVAYRVEDDRLLRVHWFVPDHTLSEEPVERELLTGVTDLRFQFLGSGSEWVPQWPQTVGAADPSDLPRAIEVVIELDDWGEIRRLIEVAD